MKKPGPLNPEHEREAEPAPETPTTAASAEVRPGSGSAAAPLDSGSGSQLLPQLLLRHYDLHRRDLPWRQDTDPYGVWVSEVMLQQTRVETVVPYYRRWLERFPDVGRLADAPADDVLKQWEGLGYYTRARNLHRAARLVRDRHSGQLPSDPEALRALPGFGEYTVGAVASIAFGRRLPAVDGNVRRVLARVYDEATPSPAWLRATAATLVPPGRPGDFNQALMELGATICAPRGPRCSECPISALCLALAAGTVADRPARKARRAVPSVTLASALVFDGGGRLLLVRNDDSGLLAGLWGLPCAEPTAGESPEEAAARAARQAGARVAAAGAVEIGSVRHQFSHFTATYRAIRFPAPAAVCAAGEGVEARWATATEVAALALAVAQRKLLKLAHGPAPSD